MAVVAVVMTVVVPERMVVAAGAGDRLLCQREELVQLVTTIMVMLQLLFQLSLESLQLILVLIALDKQYNLMQPEEGLILGPDLTDLLQPHKIQLYLI
jgi:uncharacterized Tic20 family protein